MNGSKVIKLINWLVNSRRWVGEFSIGDDRADAVQSAVYSFPLDDSPDVLVAFLVLALMQIHTPGMASIFRDLATALRELDADGGL